MNKRIFSYLILIPSIIFLPYWVYVPLLILAIVIWPFYWEALIFSLLIDFVYGRGITWWPISFSITLLALLLLVAMLPLRSRLRINV